MADHATGKLAGAKRINPFAARLLAYLCLGLALALGVPPWFQPDSKKEYVTEAGVFLSSLALSKDSLAEVCGVNIPVLDGQAMNAYPDMVKALRALKRIDPGNDRVHFKASEARALAEKQGRPDAKRLCFSFEGGTYLLQIRSLYSSSQAGLVQVGADPMQTAAAKSLSPGDLERYSFLKAYIEGLASQVVASANRRQRIKELNDKLRDNAGQKPASSMDQAISDISEIELKHQLFKERLAASRERMASSLFYQEVRSPASLIKWRPFLDGLELISGQGSVKTSDYLIRVSVRDSSEWVTTKLSFVSWIRKISGAVLFILGLWMLCRAYAPRRGMEINPRWAVVFGDVVFVLSMGVLAAGPFDYALEHWFGLVPLMDEPLQVTLSMMYLPCLFFLAWMAANLGGQSLEVGPGGVLWHGPATSRLLAWDDILSLDLRDSHVMVSRIGLPMPRRLQTKLVFKLTGDQEQEMFEPGTKHRKQAILAALTNYAPNRLRSDLGRISKEW